jgi:hypothetical protein
LAALSQALESRHSGHFEFLHELLPAPSARDSESA